MDIIGYFHAYALIFSISRVYLQSRAPWIQSTHPAVRKKEQAEWIVHFTRSASSAPGPVHILAIRSEKPYVRADAVKYGYIAIGSVPQTLDRAEDIAGITQLHPNGVQQNQVRLG